MEAGPSRKRVAGVGVGVGVRRWGVGANRLIDPRQMASLPWRCVTYKAQAETESHQIFIQKQDVTKQQRKPDFCRKPTQKKRQQIAVLPS